MAHLPQSLSPTPSKVPDANLVLSKLFVVEMLEWIALRCEYTIKEL